jgi:uncharacterized membrane protein YbhN (UPF0104 family)
VENLRKKVLTVLKIVFSVLLLYFIFNRIAFREVWTSVKDSKPIFLLSALLLFVISKWLAALRLNQYFHKIDLSLSGSSNLRLYLLGMFYNLFLPGGIGGDAYKGYLLNRQFGTPIKKLVAVLFLDRISGMYLLFVYSCLMLLGVQPLWMQGYIWAVGLLLVLSIPMYWWGHRYFFGYLSGIFWTAAGFSALVQLAQLTCAYFILSALGIDSNIFAYLLLFLLSSIVAVLPITLGGIGSRELVFFYGAQALELQEGGALGVSMVFFGITALVSLTGIGYHFKKPNLELNAAVDSLKK